MKGFVFAAATIVALTAAAATWASDPIATRQQVMKDQGAAVGTLAKMVKGETPFNADAANLAVRGIYNGAAAVPSLFPAGSETGGDTKAAPKIWQDKAGFDAEAAKLQDAAARIIATPITDLDGVKAALGAMGPVCQSCHEAYRIKS